MQTLTCRIVIKAASIFIRAVATKKGFVVVVLIPVEGLDLQATPLGMATDDAGHSLVDLGGRAGAVRIGQE